VPAELNQMACSCAKDSFVLVSRCKRKELGLGEEVGLTYLDSLNWSLYEVWNLSSGLAISGICFDPPGTLVLGLLNNEYLVGEYPVMLTLLGFEKNCASCGSTGTYFHPVYDHRSGTSLKLSLYFIISSMLSILALSGSSLGSRLFVLLSLDSRACCVGARLPESLSTDWLRWCGMYSEGWSGYNLLLRTFLVVEW